MARERAAGGAASIMRGQCWAYSSSDGPAFCRNAWDTRARNGQRRTTASILAAERDTGGDGKVTPAIGRLQRGVLRTAAFIEPGARRRRVELRRRGEGAGAAPGAPECLGWRRAGGTSGGCVGLWRQCEECGGSVRCVEAPPGVVWGWRSA